MLRNIYKDNPADLFKGDPGVETFCPRCGGRWWITESEFAGDGTSTGDEPSTGEGEPPVDDGGVGSGGA